MKKPWSISTTVRNPERIRDFLKVLKELEGEIWDRDNQRKFQILLIQNKVYGYGSKQFYTGLSSEHLKLMNNSKLISFGDAKKILDSKKYIGGGDMRGRQSFNPLEKMGLAYLDEENKVRISAVGKYFLKDNYDLGEVFFKSFLKWQLPNLNSDDFTFKEGFNIKPFIVTLQLLSRVNEKWSKLGNDPVGISKKEFALFIPTLINYEDIENYSQKIIELRLELKKNKNKKKYFGEYSKKFIQNFLNSSDKKNIDATLKNIREYTDNLIRYFRLTRYLYIRGNGHYIDLEPRRSIELKSLLESDSGKPIDFKDRKEFISYLSDINKPELTWDKADKLIEIVKKIITEINQLEKSLQISQFKQKDYTHFNKNELHRYIEDLREIRRSLQDEIIHEKFQGVLNIKECVRILKEEIYKMDDRPIVLEKYITFALNALNDALKIKPNYPVGDDNEPTNTAPAGEPDIECFYDYYNSICEVTMLRDRSQWYNEGQPVMRHLRDFEETYNKKEVYCLFIAPNLHVDTIETFWFAVKHGYRGKKQKIIPLTLKQFAELLDLLIKMKQTGKKFLHKYLFELYHEISDVKDLSDSDQWMKQIPNKINNWKERILT